jgi:glycosyltransferase involved in cell wall biosynthesis
MQRLVTHLTPAYFPNSIGGTENYVSQLASELLSLGWESNIVTIGSITKTYRWQEFQVCQLGISRSLNTQFVQEGWDPIFYENFIAWFEENRPQLIHVHGINTAISEQVISYSQKRGTRIVLTFHLQPFCQRGTLLQYGKYLCTGEYDIRKCLPCILHAKGFSEFQSKLVSPVILHLPPTVSQTTRGKWRTALQLPMISQNQHSRLLLACQSSDKIIALSHWLKDLFIANSIPQEKIALVRHGTQAVPRVTNQNQEIAYPIRLIFLGRIVPVKGLHLLINALSHIPKNCVKLDVYGTQDPDFTDYYAEITNNLPANIHFHPALVPNTVHTHLQQYHALVCPSVWFETGPLVVLESLAAGIPVLGSNFGGIAEWVEDGQNGILVEPKVANWVECLQKLIKQPEILLDLRSRITQPPSFSMVAETMVGIYQNLIGENNCAL